MKYPKNPVGDSLAYFDLAFNAVMSARAEGRQPSPKLIRGLFGCAQAVLLAQRLPRAPGVPTIPIPDRVLEFVIQEIDCLKRGVRSELATRLTYQGGVGLSDREGEAICIAVAYIKAAEDGLIAGPGVTRVVDEYGVSRPTVSKWRKRLAGRNWLLFGPEDSSEQIEMLLLKGAANYRALGRSSASIAARNSKRVSAGKSKDPRTT